MIAAMLYVDYVFYKKQSIIYRILFGIQSVANLVEPKDIPIRFK